MDRDEKRSLAAAILSWMEHDPVWVRAELAKRLDDHERVKNFDPTWLIVVHEVLRRWTGPRI